jgi:hypothetical protein
MSWKNYSHLLLILCQNELQFSSPEKISKTKFQSKKSYDYNPLSILRPNLTQKSQSIEATWDPDASITTDS